MFELFANQLKPLRLSEIADAIDAPVSSCHQLIKTLERRGYIYGLRLKSYYPTKRMLRNATAIGQHDPLLGLLMPALETLRDETGESVVLGRQSQHQIVMLEVIESLHNVRFSGHPGAVRELHCSAIGKALLGVMPPAERDRWLPDEPYPARTERTLTSRAALDDELAESRARGWYEVRGESVLELDAIAAPLMLGGTALAICLAGPGTRFAPRRQAHAETLLRSIAALEQQFADR
ncbi:MAG: IclR family transcriptional regulator [Burkholderiales bacterium]|nr:IclR family transcriptional regulator [Burkholderiales bacterium]